MCRSILALAISLSLMTACLAAPPHTSASLSVAQEASAEARLPYTEGSVYVLTFIRTRPGLTNDYLKNLRDVFRKVMEEGKTQGLILSYKVFLATAANRSDWDVMTMVEYKNMAAFDGLDEKWEAIYAKTIGNEHEQRTSSQQRGKVRDILGEKVVREIVLK